jgi:hypothetical protein
MTISARREDEYGDAEPANSVITGLIGASSFRGQLNAAISRLPPYFYPGKRSATIVIALA